MTVPEPSAATTIPSLPDAVPVSDPDDPRVDIIRHLNGSDRRPDGAIIAEGTYVIPRLFGSRYPVDTIVGVPGKLELFREEFATAISSGEVTLHPDQRLEDLRILEVSREVLASIVGFDMHRGIVGAAQRVPDLSFAEVVEALPASESTAGGAQVVAVLEGVGDHENLGSIFRNCAGLGVDALFFGGATADPLYRRSVRVSMGHVVRIPFARTTGTARNWQRELQVLRDAGFVIIAMTPNTEVTLAEALDEAYARAGEGTPRIAIMVGAEGPGLTEHAMRAADMRAAIPMSPGADSVNVATAAAIAFYAAQHHVPRAGG